MDSRHEKLVTLASKNNIVPYDTLINALDVTNERELEDFIIQCIYQDVIQARLNPVERYLEIHDWSSERCVGSDASDLNFMATTLDYWNKHCGDFLNGIGSEMDRSNNIVAEIMTTERNVGEEAENIKKSLSFDEKKFSIEKDVFKAPSKPETKRFKSGGMKNKRGGN